MEKAKDKMLTQEVAQEISQFVFRFYNDDTPEELMKEVEKILLRNNVKLTMKNENGVIVISPIYEIISWFILYLCNYGKTNDNFFGVNEHKMSLLFRE